MITEPIVLYLPWPPTINHYYGRSKKGVVYIKTKGKVYRKIVQEYVSEQIQLETIEHKIKIDVIYHPPDLRTRDLDNYNKSLLDAVTSAGVWRDDSLIDQHFKFRGQKVPGGKIVLIIRDSWPLIPNGREDLVLDME